MRRLAADTSRPPTCAGGPGVRALTVLPPGPVATSLIARTWNEYVVPSASPVFVNDVAVPTFCHWPFVASWYCVIGLPLALAALQLPVTRPVSGVALWICGAPGGPAGTTALEGALAALSPTSLRAMTVNV